MWGQETMAMNSHISAVLSLLPSVDCSCSTVLASLYSYRAVSADRQNISSKLFVSAEEPLLFPPYVDLSGDGSHQAWKCVFPFPNLRHLPTLLSPQPTRSNHPERVVRETAAQMQPVITKSDQECMVVRS